MNIKLLPVAVFGFILVAAASAQTKKLEVGKPAPFIKVGGWAKGAPVMKFASNRLYVVEFWATWCQPCRISIPHLTELAKKYKGKVTFVGVSVWEQGANIPGQVRKFVAAEGREMNYHVAFDTKSGAMAKNWMTAASLDSIPTAFVVSNKRVKWIGHPLQGLEETLDGLVSGHYDPAKAKAAADVKEQASKAAIEGLQKAYAAAIEAKKPEMALRLVREYRPAHLDQGPSMDFLELGALLQIDRKKGFAFADAKGATNPMLYMIIAQDLMGGSGIARPDSEDAVVYARKWDKSSQGDNYYSKSALSRAYEINDQKALALSTAKETLALAIKEGLPASSIEELRDSISRFGLHCVLPGDPAPALKVGGWIGGPVTANAPGIVYVFDFVSTSALDGDRVALVTALSQKYGEKVIFIAVDTYEIGKDPVMAASQLAATIGKQSGYSGFTYDNPDGDGFTAWLVGTGMVGIPRAYIVADGKLMWVGLQKDEMKNALDQILSGKFDIAKSRVDFAATVEEASILFKVTNEFMPPKKMQLIEDFISRFPSHAWDDEICDLKVSTLMRLSKSKALAFTDANGPKHPEAYVDVAGCLLSGDVIKADPPLAIVYAKRADEAARGQDFHCKYLLGEAYAAGGQKDASKANYRAALELAKKSGASKKEIADLTEIAK